MAMGDLARLPRPDEAGDSYDVPLDPWQRAVIATQALEQSPPPQPSGPPPKLGSLLGMAGAGERAKSIGEGMARSADYYVGMPSRVMGEGNPLSGYKSANPYPEGSEEAQNWDNELQDAQHQWAPSTALGMVFDPLGVKRSVGAGGVMLGSGAGSRIIQPESQGIRAYHSSPHDFEKFDFSPARARSGEGAQVYGEGGYFAENPAVSGQGGKYWQQFRERFKGPEWEAARVLQKANFDRDAAIQTLQGVVAEPGHTPTSLARAQAQLDLLTSGKPVGPRTYEVNIKARPEEMLDWNAPVGQQSPHVQQAIEAIANSNATIGSRIAALDRLGMGTGTNIYSAIGRGANPEMMALESRALASKTLQEAGIPGVRYLDEGSRPSLAIRDAQQSVKTWEQHLANADAGNRAHRQGMLDDARQRLADMAAHAPGQTYNYVMFPGTEDKVHIMAKYGLAGAVPTMGSLAAPGFNREQ